MKPKLKYMVTSLVSMPGASLSQGPSFVWRG